MKYILTVFSLTLSTLFLAQKKTVRKTVPAKKMAKTVAVQLPAAKVNDSVPALLPKKINGKVGFTDQRGNLIIKAEYSNAGFFTEDCNLQHSPNHKVRKFGSDKYASVRLGEHDYRINSRGKRVYRFREEDLGQCPTLFKAQLFHGYVLNNQYGIIEDAVFENPGDYRQFAIYPQYDYLHILEGDDLKNPMIIAAKDNKFGIIDVQNRVIIPFIYSDIKRNFSWKLARVFEVSEDSKNYFFIDTEGRRY